MPLPPRLDARERSQDGDTYVYDVDVRGESGALVERWEGLSLRAVRKRGGAGPWVPALLGSYLERSAERLLGGTRAVVVEPDPAGGLEDRGRGLRQLRSDPVAGDESDGVAQSLDLVRPVKAPAYGRAV